MVMFYVHVSACGCNTVGTTKEICDEDTGECKCKSNLSGTKCDIIGTPLTPCPVAWELHKYDNGYRPENALTDNSAYWSTKWNESGETWLILDLESVFMM